ncbi:unnamed protein product [Moneuplotes crassus]|uniref:Uncharacterized protein n=1 Tax=Euplotes crassus TaxID=5936 RepID=A0AAD2CXU1_EUPCR|nr:unnamed protein product [Moneuplotes crassus]
MIARNEKKLKHRIKEIKEKHPQANVDYIQFDFDTYNYPDENGQTQYSKLFQKIDSLEAEIVGIVNNVGILTIQPYEFMPHEVIDRMIKVNCLPAVHLTRHIIPKLLKRKSKSLILNIGAGFGEHGFPGVAVYGGTKAFIHSFTESLSSQYGGEIDVICSVPSPVESNMNPPGMKIPFSITARQHVEGTLKEIGYADQTYAHLKHDIISLIAKTPLFARELRKRQANHEEEIAKYERIRKEYQSKSTFKED